MKRAASKVRRIHYEAEGSDRRAMGSVSLRGGGWWSVDLIVSIRREDQVLLTIQRHGAPGHEDDASAVDLSLRPGDLEALPLLLSGVIEQARRDGVLARSARSPSARA